MTIMGVWSQLLGGSDYLQQELIDALAVQDSSVLNHVPLTMAQPALASTAPSIADYPLSLGTRLLGTLVMLLPDLVFMLMLWQLLQLFRGYRQAMLFTFSQIRRYQLIGLLLCDHPAAGPSAHPAGPRAARPDQHRFIGLPVAAGRAYRVGAGAGDARGQAAGR